MILGAVLVAAALLLFLLNLREDSQAGRSAEDLLSLVKENIESSETGDGGYPDPYDPDMTETEISGYSFIGYLSVPALGLELPVLSEWDYPRLRIAPCRYSGSLKTDDLVIAAHNYSRHFGRLSRLSSGDTVFFMDMDGIQTAYEVKKVEILPPTAVEEMSAGDYDLTLFTCTYGGKSRVTVRCDRKSKTPM